MEEEDKEKREEFSIRIGPLLKEVLDKQKENVNKVTYKCVVLSDYLAGEMLAKKVLAGVKAF